MIPLVLNIFLPEYQFEVGAAMKRLTLPENIWRSAIAGSMLFLYGLLAYKVLWLMLCEIPKPDQ
jgi:hypothetical protein